MNATLFFRIITGLFGLYILAVVLMYTFQRQLLFQPGRSSGGPLRSTAPEMQVVQLNTSDGLTLKAWYRAAQRPSLPTIIYFHGNAGNLSGRTSSIYPYLDDGFGVLLVSYRGYEDNPGKPTEEGLYNDGRAALEFVERQPNIDKDKIVLVGESLGSGVATQMALEYPVSALVLQGAFTSVHDVALWHYSFMPIFNSLIKDQFDNLLKIGLVEVPVLILHGTADSVVPFGLGERLYNAANLPKQSKWYVGVGHNELMSQTAPEVKRFLRDQKILSNK